MLVERYLTLDPCRKRRRDGGLDFPRAETEQDLIFKTVKLVISGNEQYHSQARHRRLANLMKETGSHP